MSKVGSCASVSSVRHVWKVVKRLGRAYISVVATPADAGVYYPVGTWVLPKPNEHPFLFAFKTRAQARQFKKAGTKSMVVFKALCANPHEDDYFTKRQYKYSPRPVCSRSVMFPTGTIFVSRVMLLKKD